MKITKFIRPVVCLALAAITFQSCEKEELDEPIDVAEVTAVTSETIPDTFLNSNDTEGREEVRDESIINSIRSLDIDIGLITQGDFVLPDGSVEQRIFVGSDISFSIKELQLLQEAHNSNRQYRTFNLVTGANRTIDILGYTANNANGLSTKAQTALGWAVNNFNNLGTTLQFNLTFGTNWQAADMVVYDTSNANNGQGGVAGFPNSSGQPNKFVQIYNIEQFSTNVNEHVITHEIGHSIGFRHSDWFDRLSCPTSSQGNEGQGSDGAVHIPGTPTGRDLTSVMQACFATNEDGEFNGNDVTALEFMYPTSTSPCDGVSEWQSGVNYPIGSRVTYFGNLYERVSGGWTNLGPC